MSEHIKQRYCTKLCQEFGEIQAQTIWGIQQAFGNDDMGKTRIKEW